MSVQSTSEQTQGKMPSAQGARRIVGFDRFDIGCGAPHQRYPDCKGIDVNPDYNPDLLHNCDEGLPFPDASASFINSDNSLEHFKNPYFVLQECFRVLRPGGKMRLVLPNAQWFPLIFVNAVVDIDWIWHRWMNLPFKRARGVHWTLYTGHLAKKVAEDLGFVVDARRGLLYSKNIELDLRKPD